jgi:hypothetical protein
MVFFIVVKEETMVLGGTELIYPKFKGEIGGILEGGVWKVSGF